MALSNGEMLRALKDCFVAVVQIEPPLLEAASAAAVAWQTMSKIVHDNIIDVVVGQNLGAAAAPLLAPGVSSCKSLASSSSASSSTSSTRGNTPTVTKLQPTSVLSAPPALTESGTISPSVAMTGDPYVRLVSALFKLMAPTPDRRRSSVAGMGGEQSIENSFDQVEQPQHATVGANTNNTRPQIGAAEETSNDTVRHIIVAVVERLFGHLARSFDTAISPPARVVISPRLAHSGTTTGVGPTTSAAKPAAVASGGSGAAASSSTASSRNVSAAHLPRSTTASNAAGNTHGPLAVTLIAPPSPPAASHHPLRPPPHIAPTPRAQNAARARHESVLALRAGVRRMTGGTLFPSIAIGAGGTNSNTSFNGGLSTADPGMASLSSALQRENFRAALTQFVMPTSTKHSTGMTMPTFLMPDDPSAPNSVHFMKSIDAAPTLWSMTPRGAHPAAAATTAGSKPPIVPDRTADVDAEDDDDDVTSHPSVGLINAPNRQYNSNTPPPAPTQSSPVVVTDTSRSTDDSQKHDGMTGLNTAHPSPQHGGRQRFLSDASMVGVNDSFKGAVHTASAVRQEDQDDVVGGFTVNQFFLVDLLGRGAQGEVYLAFDTTSGAERAVKVMPRPALVGNNSAATALDTHMDSPSQLRLQIERARKADRIYREVNIMKRCRHKNIVTLYEIIDDPEHDELYLVMQFAQKGCIAKVAPNGIADRVYSLEEVVGIGRQLCAGLRYLHGRGILHRDIKPENVLMNADGVPHLSDFGISAFFDDDAADAAEGGKGTVPFMAPELFLETAAVIDHDSTPSSTGGPTPAADVWALGVTFYVLLFGQLPWRSFKDTSSSGPLMRRLIDEITGESTTPSSELTFEGDALARNPRHDPAMIDKFGQRGLDGFFDQLVVVLKGMLHRDAKQRLTAKESHEGFKKLFFDLENAADSPNRHTTSQSPKENTLNAFTVASHLGPALRRMSMQ